MAHLLKQMTTVYLDANGNRVNKNTPGAVQSTIESAKWYVQGVPGWAKSKRKALSKDKRIATRMMNDLVEKAERGLHGMPAMDLARVDLDALIVEFETDMTAGLTNRNRSTRALPSQDQVDMVGQRLRTPVAGCQFMTVADLNDAAAGKVARYLARRAALPRKDGGLSAQTCENYRKLAGRLAWWLNVRNVLR